MKKLHGIISKWQKDMNRKTKGILTLIVAEMQQIIVKAHDKYVTKEQCLDWMQVLLDCWIEPNDLHPIDVKTIPKELTERIMKGDKTAWDEVFDWYEGN